MIVEGLARPETPVRRVKPPRPRTASPSPSRCDRPDFGTAGAHLNPGGRMHGVKNRLGPHAGDLPNLTVAEDGSALTAFFVRHLSFSDLGSSPNGTALAIDANADDDMTDPAGGSGMHIACGVITGTATSTPKAPPTVTSNRHEDAIAITIDEAQLDALTKGGGLRL